MGLSTIELILFECSALTYVEHLPRVLILEEMVQDEDTQIEMYNLKMLFLTPIAPKLNYITELAVNVQ